MELPEPEPSPEGVSVPEFVPSPDVESLLTILPLMKVAFFRVASRLSDFDISSPVARALSFTPSMFLETVKSSSLSAMSLFLMPREKMARSSILTFLPSRSSSLIQAIMSVRRPLITPLE